MQSAKCAQHTIAPATEKNFGLIRTKVSGKNAAVSIYPQDRTSGSFETFSSSTKLHAITSQKTVEWQVQTDITQ
jgi:hypothetical protein